MICTIGHKNETDQKPEGLSAKDSMVSGHQASFLRQNHRV